MVFKKARTLEQEADNFEKVHEYDFLYLSKFQKMIYKEKDILEQRLRDSQYMKPVCGTPEASSHTLQTLSILHQQIAQTNIYISNVEACVKDLDETYQGIQEKLKPENIPKEILDDKKQRMNYFSILKYAYDETWKNILNCILVIGQLQISYMISSIMPSAEEAEA